MNIAGKNIRFFLLILFFYKDGFTYEYVYLVLHFVLQAVGLGMAIDTFVQMF